MLDPPPLAMAGYDGGLEYWKGRSWHKGVKLLFVFTLLQA